MREPRVPGEKGQHVTGTLTMVMARELIDTGRGLFIASRSNSYHRYDLQYTTKGKTVLRYKWEVLDVGLNVTSN